MAGVMTALIAVDNGFVVQNRAVSFDQTVNRFDHEPNVEALADSVRQDLAGERVESG